MRLLTWDAALGLPWGVLLLFGGGILYTGGAIILGKRWLNFKPAVFGYHEVWHALTVGAGACHFALVAMIVR